MVNSWPVMIVVGTVLGFLAGLGVGGGSLLILWLTFLAGESLETARGINLLFFIPSAVIACIFRLRQNRLPLKPLVPAIVGGCLSAALMSLLGSQIDLSLLRKLFGILLIIIGLKELRYRPRNAR